MQGEPELACICKGKTQAYQNLCLVPVPEMILHHGPRQSRTGGSRNPGIQKNWFFRKRWGVPSHTSLSTPREGPERLRTGRAHVADRGLLLPREDSWQSWQNRFLAGNYLKFPPQMYPSITIPTESLESSSGSADWRNGSVVEGARNEGGARTGELQDSWSNRRMPGKDFAGDAGWKLKAFQS